MTTGRVATIAIIATTAFAWVARKLNFRVPGSA